MIRLRATSFAGVPTNAYSFPAWKPFDPSGVQDSRARLRDLSAAPRGIRVFHHALRIVIAGDLCCGSLAQLGEQQLQRGHVVAQIFRLQPFKALVFRRRHAEGRFADLGGQDGVIAAFVDAAVFPFVGKFGARSDAARTQGYPIIGITFLR